MLYSMKEICEALGLDRSNARKYAMSKGFTLLKTRTEHSKNQKTLALSKDDFDKLVSIRIQDGFSKSSPLLVTDSGIGWFYIIQLMPVELPNRIKLGYTSNWEQRIISHKVTCPQLKVLCQHKIKAVWERAIIDLITINDCHCAGGEVFDINDVPNFLSYSQSILSKFPVLKPSRSQLVIDTKIVSDAETKQLEVN